MNGEQYFLGPIVVEKAGATATSSASWPRGGAWDKALTTLAQKHAIQAETLPNLPAQKDVEMTATEVRNNLDHGFLETARKYQESKDGKASAEMWAEAMATLRLEPPVSNATTRDPWWNKYDSPVEALPNPAGRPTRESTIPNDSAARKEYPLCTGCLDYFPDALAAVAHVSWASNEKHNPGQPMHWSRGSPDHADTLVRHQARRGTIDDDGLLHSAKVAWRALAQLQEELNPGSAPK